MSAFNFRFDFARLAALGDLDPDDPHFAEKFFGLPFETEDSQDIPPPES